MTNPFRTNDLPPIKPPKPRPVDLEPGSSGRYLTISLIVVALAGSLFLIFGRVDATPSPKPSTHGDVAANVIERGISRVRYIGPADEDLGSCVCAPELGGDKASDGATRTVCACTGKAWEGK